MTEALDSQETPDSDGLEGLGRQESAVAGDTDSTVGILEQEVDHSHTAASHTVEDMYTEGTVVSGNLASMDAETEHLVPNLVHRQVALASASMSSHYSVSMVVEVHLYWVAQ